MLNLDRLHYYAVYGLTIATTRSLLGLTPIALSPLGSAAVNVTINLLGAPQPELAILAPGFWQASAEAYQKNGFYLWTTSSEVGTYWRLRSRDGEDVFDFVINPDGTQVWGFWSTEELFQDAVSLLLGAVLGHVLRLRGVLCLHASVVAVEGNAIALIGASGTGKSTTAAALAARGFSALTDDIAALYWVGDRIWVQPGYPSLRLWSPSLKALQVPVAGLSRVSSRIDKCFLQLDTGPAQSIEDNHFAENDSTNQRQFAATPLPLQAIYVLDQRDASCRVAIAQPLNSIAALHHLLTHAYGRDVLSTSQRQDELRQLAAIAQTIPIRLLHRPDDLNQLDRLCTLIINDLELKNLETQPACCPIKTKFF